MAQITIGQRVQVIDGGLTEYKQFGTVVAAGTSNSWFVQLDGDGHLASQTFFHVEELQAVGTAAPGLDQALAATEEATS
ncbi:MAG: hypothetical protein M3R24_14700 [Chloroflexota bacterium]|nr:hypothetical protein [Chloroflexota bacterium]